MKHIKTASNYKLVKKAFLTDWLEHDSSTILVEQCQSIDGSKSRSLS